MGRDEISRIADSIGQRRITQGAVTEELEKRIGDFLGKPHVVMTANGSLALLAALMECGVGPGDEVIVPAMSFIATANAPWLLGAGIRLVDVRGDAPLIDPCQVEKAINEKTKVIIPVHLGGRAADLDRIREMADEKGILVLEDAAQAFGSKNGRGWLGTQSVIGCFSLSVTKLITTGEGGFCVAANEETAMRLRKIRNNGATILAENRFDSPGFNLRQNDILSSVGLAQMDKISRKMDALQNVYHFYKSALREMNFLKLIEVDIEAGELPLWVEVLCDKRDEILDRLKKTGIQARPYPPVISDSRHIACEGDFENARYFAAHAMILPCGPDQSRYNLERTVEALAGIGAAMKLDSAFHRN